ncbi:MAG: hypothetical protein IPG50_32395 [Myxococcales bacterium]|nr:hypothetical protein [Myxococcales bacterium]
MCVANVGFVTRAKTGAAAGCDAGTVAALADPTVPSDLAALGDVLLTSGRQTGASFSADAGQQRAIISGRVRSDPLGNGVLGVPSIGGGDAVSIIGHPEFGSSKLGVDGTFDILVNGGATYRLLISVGQSFPIQRTVAVEWQDWVTIEDVVLVSNAVQSPANTALSMPTTAWQIQRGPAVNEPGHPQRQPFVLFPPNARTVLPDGGAGPAGNLQVTFTDYTVGAAGPKRMPGTLPPATAYTYAASIRALVGGVMQSEVNFDPVARPILYVDDFITTNPSAPGVADAGSWMPNGYFDPSGGAWLPSDDPVTLAKSQTIGRVVSLVCTPTQSLTGAPVANRPFLRVSFRSCASSSPPRPQQLPSAFGARRSSTSAIGIATLAWGPDGAGYPPNKPSGTNDPKPDPGCTRLHH